MSTLLLRIGALASLPLFLVACGAPSAPAVAPTPLATAGEARPANTPEAAPAGDDSDLPRVVRLLSTEYQAAYRLLPNGAWARRHYAGVFNPDEFDWKVWESGEVYDWLPEVTPTPELDAGLAFELTIILRDEDERDWLIERIRALDASSSADFELARTESERIEVFRQMLTLPGIDVSTLRLEILAAWQNRASGLSQEASDRILIHERVFVEIQRAFREIWLTQGDNAMALYDNELRICQRLMWDVLGRNDLWVVISKGQCDIVGLTRMVRAALQSGAAAVTEADYREYVEFSEEQE